MTEIRTDFSGQPVTPHADESMLIDRFVPDREDQPGQPTCEGGQHLPIIGMTAATLARAIADFVGSGLQRDYAVSLSGVAQT